MKLIFFARQNALKSSISCSDESSGSSPHRIHPGAHSRIELAGRPLKNFFSEAAYLRCQIESLTQSLPRRVGVELGSYWFLGMFIVSPIFIDSSEPVSHSPKALT